MNHNEVDITYTVKAGEANGRQLIKNLDTGETRWEDKCDDEEHDPLSPVKQPTKAEMKKLEAQIKALNKTYQD